MIFQLLCDKSGSKTIPIEFQRLRLVCVLQFSCSSEFSSDATAILASNPSDLCLIYFFQSGLSIGSSPLSFCRCPASPPGRLSRLDATLSFAPPPLNELVMIDIFKIIRVFIFRQWSSLAAYFRLIFLHSYICDFKCYYYQRCGVEFEHNRGCCTIWCVFFSTNLLMSIMPLFYSHCCQDRYIPHCTWLPRLGADFPHVRPYRFNFAGILLTPPSIPDLRIFLEIYGKVTILGRVWFELLWVGLFGLMELGKPDRVCSVSLLYTLPTVGASLTTSQSTSQLCAEGQIGEPPPLLFICTAN